MKEHAARSTRIQIVLMMSLGAFTLWDYYLGSYGEGVRLFDFLAVGLILISLLATLLMKGQSATESIRLPVSYWALVLAFVLLFSTSGLIGTVHDQANFFRPTLGIMMGLAVFIFCYFVNISDIWIDRVVGWLLIIHIFAFFVQFAVYRSAGVLVNYQAIIGVEPHVFSSIFRPSGLFLEPGSYAVTVTMLLLLRWFIRTRLDWISWITLVSTLFTVSLFGILAVCSIIVFYFRKQPWFWPAVCVVVLLLAILGTSAFNIMPEVFFLKNRLLNISSDASVLVRYAGLVGALQGTGDVSRLWFGGGLDNYREFGSSGISFLIAYIGIVGALLWLLIVLSLSPYGRRIHILFSLLLILFAAPMWTMMIWWAWLGLLLNRSLQRPTHGFRHSDSTRLVLN